MRRDIDSAGTQRESQNTHMISQIKNRARCWSSKDYFIKPIIPSEASRRSIPLARLSSLLHALQGRMSPLVIFIYKVINFTVIDRKITESMMQAELEKNYNSVIIQLSAVHVLFLFNSVSAVKWIYYWILNVLNQASQRWHWQGTQEVN